ncbi:MAG TPA: hypothetical protein VFZ80_02100 [Acidimicrobiia bacterium]
MRRGVWYLNVTPATWRTEVLAATLTSGRHAVASHRTAGAIYQLDGIYGRILEVTVPYSNQPAPPGVILHRTRRSIAPTSFESLIVTSPARTLLDLAAFLPDRVLEKAMASAFRKRLTTPDEFDSTIGRLGGRGVGGTRRARRVLRAVANDLSGSVAEVDLAQLIRDAPIPSPVQQLRVELPGGRHAYPDFAWPDRMRIAEVDGLETHASQDQLASDLDRQNQLLDLGWEIRRWPAQTVRREPQRVIGELTRFVLAPTPTLL